MTQTQAEPKRCFCAHTHTHTHTHTHMSILLRTRTIHPRVRFAQAFSKWFSMMADPSKSCFLISRSLSSGIDLSLRCVQSQMFPRSTQTFSGSMGTLHPVAHENQPSTTNTNFLNPASAGGKGIQENRTVTIRKALSIAFHPLFGNTSNQIQMACNTRTPNQCRHAHPLSSGHLASMY